MDNKKIAYKASILSIIGNVFLSFFKLIAGVLGHSLAMISDAIHSISDVFSTIVVIIGIKLSNKEMDDDHPYGHERFECVAALILSFMLFGVGVMIGYEGIINIIKGEYKRIVFDSQVISDEQKALLRRFYEQGYELSDIYLERKRKEKAKGEER